MEPMNQSSNKMDAKLGLADWISYHRLELSFLVLLLILGSIRGYWTPDEPDFAQCIKEMRQGGDWLLPRLNGQIYTEKPILFYWLMKCAAISAEGITGGLGFARGIAPWALRLPSILAATALVFGMRAWARRFLDLKISESGMLILLTTPIWIWQAQAIQIDMLFSALLAWSWMSWIAGYLIQSGLAPAKRVGESRRWFILGYISLGLAVMAKGPLALVLSGAVVLSFLCWQRDWSSLRGTMLLSGIFVVLGITLPWYLAAGIRGGPQYLYTMVIHQNVTRALSAWDHIQPWWRYFGYLAADFFPWSLLVPFAIFAAIKNRAALKAVDRFSILACIIPLVLLSLSKSKQGKYLLVIYPFLAMIVSSQLQRSASASIHNLRRLIGAGLLLPGLAFLLVGLNQMGGAKLLTQVQPFLGPLRLSGLILVLGGLWVSNGVQWNDGRRLVLHTALPLVLIFCLVLPWGMVRLDPLKDYKGWADQTEPFLANRRVFFWGDIRSGAMIYSDRLMPVLTTTTELGALGPEDRLIVTDRRWKPGTQGLDLITMGKFRAVYRQQQGGDGMQVLAPCLQP